MWKRKYVQILTSHGRSCYESWYCHDHDPFFVQAIQPGLSSMITQKCSGCPISRPGCKMSGQPEELANVDQLYIAMSKNRKTKFYSTTSPEGLSS